MSHKGNKLNIMEDSNPSEGLMAACTNLARRIVRLPLNIVGAISRTLGNAAARRNPASNPDPQQQREQNDGILIIPEEWFFLTLFERQFGESHPFFYACRFAEALKIAKDESKLVFLYLHSPQSPLTALFCHDTLCSQLVIEFLDANFVSWGAVASRGEGLEMASGLQASTFPFCAVVAPATGKAIVVLQQVEGQVSPQELVEILQRTMDAQGSAFRGLKEAEEEEMRANRQLRKEQDAAFHEALQKDMEKEQTKEVLEESVRAAAERRAKEHKERLQRYPGKLPVSKQKEICVESITLKQRQPITKIRIRFPDGSRKEFSFLASETIRSIYKYIDSDQDLPGIGSYQLVSFPKIIFGYEQLDMTLKDAGLYPNAALFLEQLK